MSFYLGEELSFQLLSFETGARLKSVVIDFPPSAFNLIQETQEIQKNIRENRFGVVENSSS